MARQDSVPKSVDLGTFQLVEAWAILIHSWEGVDADLGTIWFSWKNTPIDFFGLESLWILFQNHRQWIDAYQI